MTVRPIASRQRPDIGRSFLPGVESRLDMPAQDLSAWQGKPAVTWKNHSSVTTARLFAFGGAVMLSGFGTWEIYKVVSVNNISVLQFVFAALFAVTFAWIAFSCMSAVLGFIRVVRGKPRPLQAVEDGPLGRTALLMPVYNEDPQRVFETLTRMGEELVACGAGRAFDVFVLSDTRNEETAKQEEREIRAIRMRFRGRMHFFYRRRRFNSHRKAGNVADFVTRFGGDYEHMIVLDADSYMSADVMTALARTMHADATAGIIQTLPLLMNRTTLFARLQQFASRVYGPVITHGLAAWHGRDGNYWGHNAIIRTRAFAEAAGLPELEGRKPFGGHILSHDFVEAALIRRAGWSVYMLPDLPGSYEECPPSLIDLAGRDRRWCQGNLQHLKVIGASGLHWVSRVHLAQGVMSYLASPLWLAFMLIGLGLSAQAQFIRPEYFPDGFALFPVWPIIDPERALRLFVITMTVLFLPKVLGVIAAMLDPQLRKGCGGVLGLVSSMLAEIAVSSLLSPVMMMIQTRFVADIFLGRDSGWSTQNRGDEALPVKVVAGRHWHHMLEGAALAAIALAISWETFLWMLPITIGLALAVPVSWATSLASVGLFARRIGLFLIPEERVEKAMKGLPEPQVQPVLEPRFALEAAE